MDIQPDELLATLSEAGVGRGDLVTIALAAGVGLGVATATVTCNVACADPSGVVGVVEAQLRPRWVMWSNRTAAELVAGGVRLDLCWDVAAVHRLLFGGWRADPATVWARLHDLTTDVAGTAPADLFSASTDDGGDPDEPVRPDGHLDADWAAGGWASRTERLGR